MQSASPSRTALRVALRRAAHQLYDAKPLVFEDPIAVPILGKDYAEDLSRTPGRSLGGKERPFSIGLRAFLVARSRYAEDILAGAVAAGVRQYVLLGAGLDTFAHRNPYPQLHVFEVDHPATQQWKQELMEGASLATPEKVAYVPVNFEEQSLSTQLQAAGFDSLVPTVFAWLGVVPYLTLEAFRGTIAFVSRQAAGSAVVLDYAQPRSVLPFFEQLAHDSLASRVQQAGEPFQLFFTPAEIAGELRNFRAIEDLGSTEINTRYFTDRADSLRVLGSAGRLLSAWI
ncbi:class I SAM-dependent methyltransferase [Granulicella sp. S190]|uniref:class I SAM-dependent methyltransferase n=1 Tax=Granulicella sp. S190 TaxID=1747226 RepID=UPI00131BC44A|nr:class I SAM-dependent methyltransferase [Granulicella sp. S190]